ncbi:caspase family protein, partial [Alphaproteobacteria bacterium]|nr:caspase family protein [Alphaproteobacteria bacterium]
MQRSLTLIVLLIISTLSMQATAMAARFALVIGNADYDSSTLAPLNNPANEAVLISDSLRKAGFEVTMIVDADLRAMKKAIKKFGTSLAGAGSETTALFYFSGHGFQANNLNYLAPIGADLEDEVDAEFEALSVDWVLARLERYNKGANIVLLDACRNTALSRAVGGSSQGLTLLSKTPIGSFISYSTAPGSTATDGTGLNSPYTAAIAREIIQPGVSIEQAFKKVRRSVVEETAGKQVPWDYSSLTADIVFVPSTDLVAIAKLQGVADSTVIQAELQFWNDVKNSGIPESLQAYLVQYPNGV